jgi:hypothetical protein
MATLSSNISEINIIYSLDVTKCLDEAHHAESWQVAADGIVHTKGIQGYRDRWDLW